MFSLKYIIICNAKCLFSSLEGLDLLNLDLQGCLFRLRSMNKQSGRKKQSSVMLICKSEPTLMIYMNLLYTVPKASRYHNELFLEQGVLEQVH
jgi:hypothetical protein